MEDHGSEPARDSRDNDGPVPAEQGQEPREAVVTSTPLRIFSEHQRTSSGFHPTSLVLRTLG